MTDPYANLDDAELMVRIKAGEQEALGAVYDRHGTAAYALALAILRDPPEAEDAVAKAFAQIWSGRDRFDAAHGTLGAWLNTIVRSRALDLYRARGRRARAYDAARTAAEPAWEPVGPEEQAHQHDLRKVVAAALHELPEEQRRALAMAYFEGLTHSEIATALEIPLGTVKTRIRTAMLRLRERLAGQPELRLT